MTDPSCLKLESWTPKTGNLMAGLDVELPADDRSLEEATHHDELYTDPKFKNYDELDWNLCVKEACDPNVEGRPEHKVGRTFVNHNPHPDWGKLWDSTAKPTRGKVANLTAENSIMPQIDETLKEASGVRQAACNSLLVEWDKQVAEHHKNTALTEENLLRRWGTTIDPQAPLALELVNKHRDDGTGKDSDPKK